MRTPIIARVAVLAVLGLASAWAVPAEVQNPVPCGAPFQAGTADRTLNEAFTREVTLKLIDHDAGNLGPVLWAYIAGQARAESLKNMRKNNGTGPFQAKPGNNLWNTQKESTADECNIEKNPDNPAVDRPFPCSKDNQKNYPTPAVSKKKRDGAHPCWEEAGGLLQMGTVCSPKYGTLEEAADAYLVFMPRYGNQLRKLAEDGSTSAEDFFQRLKASHWSERHPYESYRTETLAAIDDALRGLASVRDTDQKALEQVQEEIERWCAQTGPEAVDDRQDLADKQKALINALSTIAQVCLSADGRPATVPTGTAAIDDCRQNTPKPQQDTAPAPSGGSQAPGGAAAGVGEPHYTLPGGAALTTQRAGEFWLLDAAGDFKVQVRHTPWYGSSQVAAITAVAVRVGRSRASIDADGTVRLDGRPLSWTGRFAQRDLGDGHALGIWGEAGRPSTVAVMASDGRYLRALLRGSWMDVGMHWPRGAGSAADRGLVGTGSSDAAGTLMSRDGHRGKLANPDDVTAFVDSWRIEAQESLFDYAAGESGATFDRRDFPVAPANPSAEALAAARKTCEAAGVGPAQLGACAFDVAVTGDAAFAQSHLQATQAMRQVPTAQGVARQPPPPAEPARACEQNSDCGVDWMCDKSDGTRWRCVKRKGMGEPCSSDVECHGGLGGTQRICDDKEKVCADRCRTGWDCRTNGKCPSSGASCIF